MQRGSAAGVAGAAGSEAKGGRETVRGQGLGQAQGAQAQPTRRRGGQERLNAAQGDGTFGAAGPGRAGPPLEQRPAPGVAGDTGEDYGTSIWRSCLEQLDKELSREEFTTLIRPLQVDRQGATLVLFAPNKYVLAQVEEGHAARLRELVAQFDAAAAIANVEFREGSLDGPFDELAGRKTPLRAPRRRSPVAVAPRPSLNGSFTFESFVEGKSNELAKAAAWQVAENPGQTYNPLLLYGGVGLGKTHLMHAVGHEIIARSPRTAVVYLHSERFTNDMVMGIRTNTIQEVMQRYRTMDVLLIDDIQFFAEKGRSQEEFFHVFNAVLERGSQIVLSSDRYPREINGLEERLQSRFSGGLTVEVEMPELETRVAILQNKAEAEGIGMPNEVAFQIARNIPSNVRVLEGALQRVIASAKHIGAPVTMELMRRALRDLFAIQSRQVTVDHIQKVVAEYYNIKHSDMLSKRRTRAIARPRQVAMCLAKEFTNHSLPDIGERFGGRDHTTVLYACCKIAELRESDADMAEDYRNLSRTLHR